MISCNDIQTLLRPDVREQIAVHLNDDPTKVALSLRENGPLVATQIKYLQRARTKLPSYYAAQCILPPLSFEQASSEESASLKHYAGHTCLDLTCGLGVDTLHFSNHFDQVVTVEQNPELCEIARINFERLQTRNIRIQSATAEQFVADLISGQKSIGPIDLIYIDPARRDSQGKKVWLLEDCSPDVKRLLPSLLQLSPLVVIKASPLFDIDEAFRLFGEECSVEIISVHGECKEVLMEIHRPQSDHSTTHIATSTHLVPSNTDTNLTGENRSTSSEKITDFCCFKHLLSTDGRDSFDRLRAPIALLFPQKGKMVGQFPSKGCTTDSSTKVFFRPAASTSSTHIFDTTTQQRSCISRANKRFYGTLPADSRCGSIQSAPD